jgi:hypothetical protein
LVAADVHDQVILFLILKFDKCKIERKKRGEKLELRFGERAVLRAAGGVGAWVWMWATGASHARQTHGYWRDRFGLHPNQP